MSTDRNFNTLLRSGVEALGVDVSENSIELLALYFIELKHWGKKINLIAKGSSDRDIIEKHFLDSLSLISLLKKENTHLLDVGTGAGFPGLVCKVAQPRLKLTLVEPRLKRVSFLRHIIRKLNLSEVQVVAGRVEDTTLLPSNLVFSHITSRAVTDIGAFFELTERFFVSGTQIICMKGAKWQDEMVNLTQKPKQTLLFKLPLSKAQRALLVFEVE